MLYYIDVIELKEYIQATAQDDKIHFNYSGIEYSVSLSRQKTGFGVKTFFLCPHCRERRTRLYLCREGIRCRSCCPQSPYYGLTHTTKGGTDSIEYRMHRLAQKYGIVIEKPFHYLDFPKPKGWNDDEWALGMKKLQALENMRFQSIFFNKKYDNSTIKSVIEGTNKLLFERNHYEISKYLYDWDCGAAGGKPSGIASNASAYQLMALQRSKAPAQ